MGHVWSTKNLTFTFFGSNWLGRYRPAEGNLKKESKTHPNTKVRLAPKSTIWHFWSVERYFKSAELHSFGLWPNSLRVPIRHTIFAFFTKRHVPIRILPMVAYFLSIPVSINSDWIPKFRTFFYTLRETHFHTLKFLIPLFWYSLLN